MPRPSTIERNKRICELYASGDFTTKAIAKSFGLSRRRVEQIAGEGGVIRTAAESNRVIAPLKPKHRIRLRVKPTPYSPKIRRQLTKTMRYQIIAAHPWCAVCGARPEDGARLEVDHIDDQPGNNAITNLQVLCQTCNICKYHAIGRAAPEDVLPAS